MEKGRWWNNRVVYQVYPISFNDSNGDGIGDIKGIIEKIDYFKFLGVGAIWLNPIYDSPNDDMGYDIRDYEKIQKIYGTNEDFKELLKKLHDNNIKLIMDLVVNHSSDEHKWFIESKKGKDNPYHDYYIWNSSDKNTRPSNLASFFTPSAWKYCDQAKQWYLHLFSEKQPDLNWENQNLRNDIFKMINNKWFFITLGVHGIPF